MKKRIAILAVVAALVVALAGCSSDGREVRMGAGEESGTYYAYSNAIADATTDLDGALTFKVKTTAGSAANVRLLSEGYVDVAIAQSDVVNDALEGKGSFAKSGPFAGYSAIAGLYIEQCQIVVPADSPVQSVRDLAGLRVSIGERDSGITESAKEILQVYGLDDDTVDIQYRSVLSAADQMKQGSLDAFFVTANAPSNVIAELANTMSIRLIPIDDTAATMLMTQFGGYTRCTIPANTYPGQTEDVPTVGVKAVLLARNDMPAPLVALMLKAVFENSAEIQAKTKVSTTLDVAFATTDIPVGFHQGAVDFYRTLGVNVPASSGEQEGKALDARQDG